MVLLEAGDDVGDGTSRANTHYCAPALIPAPGALESKLVPRGHELLSAYADTVRTRSNAPARLLVTWNQEELETLPALEQKARDNGYERCATISANEIYREFAATRPGGARCARGPGQIDHLHLDDQYRAGD